MTKEFIPYEQALELKELEFNEECFGKWFEYNGTKYLVRESELKDDWWENNAFDLEIPAPLYQQAFRWFREKHKLEGLVERSKGWYKFTIYYYLSNSKGYIDYEIEIDTYEEAELACLRKLIELIKQISHERNT